MEKKQLLLITKNEEFITKLRSRANFTFDLTSVTNIQAGYTLALGYLPDAILIDTQSMESGNLKRLRNFKSTHFLNKSFLFLYGETQKKQQLEKVFRNHVDKIFYDHLPIATLWEEIEQVISIKQCLTNYWKDSFMGLFNLLKLPIVLLQNEDIIAMNDSFKKYFYVTSSNGLKVTDFVDCKNKYQILDTLRNFARGKHMKASTKASLLLMGSKKRGAKISFSKLDKALSGQMVMMIDFEEQEPPINTAIGSSSKETEQFLAKNNNSVCNFSFTKREKEIIGLLCKGYKTKEISETLCISSKTIEKHRSNIIKRTNSDTILESIVYALNNNLIEI